MAKGNFETPRKRILIVEDDHITRMLLRETLEWADFTVETASDGPDALTTIRRQGLPHLVLVDLGLPTMHGFELSRQIKRMADVPIIILTGDNSRQTATEAIQQFAEDYIVKPFDMGEVVARIRRILGRLPGFEYADAPVTVIDGHLSIDFVHSQILIDGQPIDLTPTEAGLLYHLVRNAGRIVTPESLMARVWPNEPVQNETLRVHMHRLRRKVRPHDHLPKYIHTERDSGYFFRAGDN